MVSSGRACDGAGCGKKMGEAVTVLIIVRLTDTVLPQTWVRYELYDTG
jgi:hypothetical protein